jgi:hypothetical protein
MTTITNIADVPTDMDPLVVKTTSASQEDFDDLHHPIKRSGSVGGHTFATMAESDYSLAASYDVDRTHRDADLEDSLSSHEESADQLAADPHGQDATGNTSADSYSSSASRMPREKVPSSLHIPSIMEESLDETSEETKADESDSVMKPVSEMENSCSEPVDVEASESAAAEASEAAPEADDLTVFTNTSAAPQRKSISMIKYKPSDRSITVALSPAKPSLRRHSSYGNKNEKIPLNFDKRGSLKVLPKPDLRALGREALERSASAPTPATRSNSSSNRKNSVVFDKIVIREHQITMGDNPSCSYGTPISLDWDYIDFEELTLEDYEMHKITSGRGRPRTLRQLYLNHYQRVHRLQQEGYTEAQIKARKHEVSKSRKQRNTTRFLAQAKVLVHLEDIVESAGRKVSRAIKPSGTKTKPPQQQLHKPLSRKEQEKQLLLKVMGGDDTVETARVVQSERDSNNLMPVSIRRIEG